MLFQKMLNMSTCEQNSVNIKRCLNKFFKLIKCSINGWVHNSSFNVHAIFNDIKLFKMYDKEIKKVVEMQLTRATY